MSEARALPLRLAIVRQRYNPYGGAERIIEAALPALAAEDIAVEVLAREWKGGPGVRVHRVESSGLTRTARDRRFARAARGLWQREGFHLVQSHERIAGAPIYRAGDGVHRTWLSIRAETAGRFERIGMRLSPYHRYVCAEEERMFRHADLLAVVANSQMVSRDIIAQFGVATKRVRVIYNGVDLERFHPRERPAHREAQRSKLGLRPDEPAVVFVGSGFARKGLDVAIQALAIARTRPRLLVVGADRHWRGFAAQADRSGVAERVYFVGGVEDVRPWLAAADAFVLPTRYDPFPNAALEALASGLPAIVTDRCGVAEVLTDRDAGRVIPANDPPALAQSIDEVLGGPSSLASVAARRLAEPFSIARMAGEWVALYQSLVRQGRS